MDDIVAAISTTFGISVDKCKKLSPRSALVDIPSTWIEDGVISEAASRNLAGYQDENVGIQSSGKESKVLVTAVKNEEILTKSCLFPLQGGEYLQKSFSSILLNAAKANESEMYRKVAADFPNCYFHKMSKSDDMDEAAFGEIKWEDYFEELFGKIPPQKTGNGDNLISSNLRKPKKVVAKNDVIFFVYTTSEFSVKDVLMYSPYKFTVNDIEPSFILFQILQFFSIFESKYLMDLSSVHWDQVIISQSGWIQVHLPESCLLKSRKKNSEFETPSQNVDTSSQFLPDMVDHWISGTISNFDYLMFLNRLAGRSVDDPNHHPILPWVSTLEDENSWRDLTKTKYRLNKGDHQLDIQFDMMKEASNGLSQSNLSQVPHHVPEFLSDITYYVYMARRTPKSTLCKLVRSYWEPNEYPSSIKRMQEWTPDECIPEFYTDPTVFESLHDDMNDLAIPNWCEDPADFIKKHRQMLESDEVSSKLHNWIDVTFGYKLSGDDAKRAKNVCLPLVDNQTILRKRGIAQLFSLPHPRKRIQGCAKHLPPTSETYDLDDSFRVHLTQNLKPGRELVEFEKLLDFKEHVCHNPTFHSSLMNDFNESRDRVLHHGETERNIRDRNVATFICLAIELYLSIETLPMTYNLNIEDRFKYCIKIFKSNYSKFPSSFRCAIWHFIQNLKNSEDPFSRTESLYNGSIFESFSEQGHPIPTVFFLSSRYIHDFPFPDYFHDLYEILDILQSQTLCYTKSLPISILDFVAQKLGDLFDDMHDTEDCLKLLIPHLNLLLEDDICTAVPFLVMNFETISKAMGERSTHVNLLPSLLNLYDSLMEEELFKYIGSQFTEFPANLILEIFQKPFLLQVSTRIGLNKFLTEMPRCLADALIHKWDSSIGETSKLSFFWLMDRIGPTLTSKFIIKHLFRVLTVCFLSENAVKSAQYQRVRDCLLHAAELFGPSFITLQYFPFLNHRISAAVAHIKFARRHQVAIQSSLVALSHLITYLSDSVLMEELARITNQILIPTMELLGRRDLSFPDEISGRKSLCMEVIHLMALVVVRIGREMSRKHLSELFKTFFSYFDIEHENRRSSSFDAIDSDSLNRSSDSALGSRMIENPHTAQFSIRKPWMIESPTSSPSRSNSPIQNVVGSQEKAKAKSEIIATFCPETAYKSFVSFTRVLGGIHMENVLGKYFNIMEELSKQHVETLDKEPPLESTCQSNNYHSDITVIGNQLVAESPPQPSVHLTNNDHDFDILPALLKSSGGAQTEDQLGASARRTLKTVPALQLTENWLAYWEHEIGLPDNDGHIHFNQIELESFSGHASSVRCLASHPSEEWFVSGGKDKTIKIWSVPENLDLRDSRDAKSSALTEKYTYRAHKKPISYVGIMESEQYILSNDGNIHLWDPYSSQTVVAFDSTDVKTGFALATTLPSPYRFCLAVTNELDLRILDLRRKLLANELKIVLGTSMGIPRAMCVLENGNRVAVGFSSGMVSAIDIRMGNKLTIKPSHESDISTMVSISEKRYLTASSDQTIALWDSGQQPPLKIYKSFQEPIHTAEIFHDEIVSGSVANRISVHVLPNTSSNDSGLDKPISVSKLRNDTFRGVMTTFTILPMKRQLLLASDNGSIKLMA